jgi:hypothetical protein
VWSLPVLVVFAQTPECLAVPTLMMQLLGVSITALQDISCSLDVYLRSCQAILLLHHTLDISINAQNTLLTATGRPAKKLKTTVALQLPVVQAPQTKVLKL